MDLAGSAENQGACRTCQQPATRLATGERYALTRARMRTHARTGDLKSVVLHKMTLSAQKSTFPVALGIRLTGVDDSCFSQTGGKTGS